MTKRVSPITFTAFILVAAALFTVAATPFLRVAASIVA